jgi:hypothetical protein
MDRFMGSHLFLSDLLTGHEPENLEWLEMNRAIRHLRAEWR